MGQNYNQGMQQNGLQGLGAQTPNNNGYGTQNQNVQQNTQGQYNQQQNSQGQYGQQQNVQNQYNQQSTQGQYGQQQSMQGQYGTQNTQGQYGQQQNAFSNAASQMTQTVSGEFNADKLGKFNFKLGLYVALAAVMFMVGSWSMILYLFALVLVVEKDKELTKCILSMGISLMILVLFREIWSIVQTPISMGLSSILRPLKYDSIPYNIVIKLSEGLSSINTLVGLGFDIVRIFIGFKFLKTAKTGSYKINKIVSQYLQ